MQSVFASSSWYGPSWRNHCPPLSIPLRQPTFSICDRYRAPIHGVDIVVSSTRLVLPHIRPASAQGRSLPRARTVSNRLVASTLHPQGEWSGYRLPHTVCRGSIWMMLVCPNFCFPWAYLSHLQDAFSTDGKLTPYSPWENLPEREQDVVRQVKGDVIKSTPAPLCRIVGFAPSLNVIAFPLSF